jgi:hypothetical protein
LIEPLGQLEVVAQSVLETDVEEGKETALHNLRGRKVGRRGLVMLGFLGERVAQCEPSG